MLALLKRDVQKRERVQSHNLIYPLTPLTKRERSIRKSRHQEHLLTELPLDQGCNLIPQNTSWKWCMPSLMILMQ
jgi:hypothetical protein